jgi:hypothetical protein
VVPHQVDRRIAKGELGTSFDLLSLERNTQCLAPRPFHGLDFIALPNQKNIMCQLGSSHFAIAQSQL